MAAPEMRYQGQGGADGDQRQPRMALRRDHQGGMPGGLEHQLLLDFGCLFMLLGALVLTWPLGPCTGEHGFIAFLLWLLGASAAMLSLVAQRFPGLAAAGAAAATATALRNYLLGGL